MSSNSFSTLKNGIDVQLEIIQHDDSGFYNITKTAKMIMNIIKNKENDQEGIVKSDEKVKSSEAAGIPAASNKLAKPYEFFKINSTNELIDECKKQTGLETVHYELKKGVPTKYAGMYVHKLLYDHFLAWLDPRYAIKISIILDNIHNDANKKLIEQKNRAIDELRDEIRKQSEEARIRDEEAKLQIQKQSSEIQELLSYAKETKSELSEARLDIQDGIIKIEDLTDTVDELNDKVEECR